VAAGRAVYREVLMLVRARVEGVRPVLAMSLAARKAHLERLIQALAGGTGIQQANYPVDPEVAGR